MRKKTITLLYLSMLLLGLSVGLIFYSSVIIIETSATPMDVEIVNSSSVGFNLDIDKIHFGQVPLGSAQAYREFNLTNPYEFPIRLTIFGTGEMSPWLHYEIKEQAYEGQVDFELDTNEEVQIRYVLEIPKEDVEVGQTYEGTLHLRIQRKIPWDTFL